MIQKQSLNINFIKGLNTKDDPWQIAPDNFLSLQNSVFTTGGRLTKRNGYKELSGLPADATYLTTVNENLTAIGQSIYARNETSDEWVTKGNLQPMQVNTLSLIRNNLNQTQCDAAVSKGLVCTVYSEVNNSTTDYAYAIADAVTGQNIWPPSPIPQNTGTVTGNPRVFVLGNYFVIVFTNVISATSHLQYVAISIADPNNFTVAQDIAASYVPATTLSWDGVVYENNLYIAYNTTAGGQAIKVTYLSATSAAVGGPPVTAASFSTYKATIMSICVDATIPQSPVIWVPFYRLDTTSAYILAVDQNLNTILAPTGTIHPGTATNLTSAAQNGTCYLYFEVANNYSYDSSIASHLIKSWNVDESGTISGATVIIRGVGLASKAFQVSGTIYFLTAYQNIVGTPYQNNGNYQPSYFLINASLSTSATPVVAGKLAYSNAGNYLTVGLPGVTIINGNECFVPYLFKDSISAVNKGTDLASGTQVAGIYSQTGINLGTFTIGTENIDTAEIGKNLLISGGFLWSYDGYLPVEQNFLLWPDSIEAAGSGTSGNMTAQQYYYQVTYEWQDNQGNLYRSAPSIPVTVTLTSDTSVDIAGPYLRMTMKTDNPVKIVIYRWSVAQPVYYQVTSLVAPLLNVTTQDSWTYNDGLADSSIIGNNIIYTNGGVLENLNGPASNVMTLFDNRYWMLDAEDQNLFWYSKQVIENVPVEMSDLLTYYVAPTTGAQGSTGPAKAAFPMDDKLIVFKANAIYYINGTGPDNTGANSQYSQPIFITSTVGCSNQASIVFQPAGLMFQSEKGIWLLGRDLSTQYIGAPVEAFNSSVVTSAVNIPESNQVRFTLSTGETLMYDYYYEQWGTFVGVPAISSCIYQGFHTCLDSYNRIFQESPGFYMDGTNPVLMQLTTAWFNLSGLQGYQRAFFFYLLGQYLSPHKLAVSIAYNYNPSPQQMSLIAPINYSNVLGGPTPNPGDGTDSESPLGQTEFYGSSTTDGAVEQWRVFLTKQRCQAFQISLQEIYDSTFGVPAGQGLTLSGINLIYGSKQKFRPQAARTSIGGGTA